MNSQEISSRFAKVFKENNDKNIVEVIAFQDKEIERLNNILNGIDNILIEHIDECREELDVILKGDDLVYINQCTKEFDVIRKNIEMIQKKIKELKEKE